MNPILTLTPNRRLARFLRQQSHPGKIMAWNDWLLESWQMHHEFINPQAPLQCLSDWQSELLWHQVITQHNGDPLLNKTQAVQHARQAFSLSIQWACDETHWAGEKQETDIYLIWSKAYRDLCEKNHWIDPILIPEQLKQYWKNHPQDFPQTVELYGFDELNPQQLSILPEQIKNLETSPKPYTYLVFNDRNAQITQAALYAKEALTQAPALPIGVIVPDLQDHWDAVHSIFTDILGPDQPFNISAGRPLAQCPIIDAALQCLQGENLRFLLLSPYIAQGLTEQCDRALFDEKLSRFEIDPLPFDFIQHHEQLPEEFKKTLHAASQQKKHYQDIKLLPSEWIEQLFDHLQTWAWPGERNLNSVAYQAVHHFYTVVTELASLDFIVQPCSYSKIISLLSQRLHKTMFQPESNDKPIQVLGVLEAAGLSFSHLWVMDMGNDTWPDKPSPNPFIPIQDQIKLGLPHASFARELRFAQTMTRRLLSSADHIILSYAAHGEEGEAMILPSPLIEQTPQPAPEREHLTLAQALFAARKLEPMPEPIGLPAKQFKLKGGVRVFQDQAACPFRAYAHHRLSAKSLTSPQMGLSSRVKGSVLHDALEMIWKEDIIEKIHQALNQVIPPISPIERDLETQRLLPILQRWFAMELEREPFHITALEKSYSVTLEGLQLQFRIDRIDSINGELCIIDYKTGKVNTDDWLDTRMNEPQLPLYACVIDPTPQAIAFAQIRKDKMVWKGLGNISLPGITPVENWEKQINTWKQGFAVLANEYKQGHAAVDPKNIHQTCQYCDLRLLCRINKEL